MRRVLPETHCVELSPEGNVCPGPQGQIRRHQSPSLFPCWLPVSQLSRKYDTYGVPSLPPNTTFIWLPTRPAAMPAPGGPRLAFLTLVVPSGRYAVVVPPSVTRVGAVQLP